MDLTDVQWELISPYVAVRPRIKRRKRDGRGRPRVLSRPILNAIFWIMRTGRTVG
jgi:transposase